MMESRDSPGPQSSRWRRVGSIALVTAVFSSLLLTGVGPVAAQSQQDSPTLVVDVADNGDVDLTIVMTDDLANVSEREAFETLQNDEEAFADLESRFADRMDGIATATSNRVDRDVVATDETVDLETSDDTGIVRLSVTMENLAAVEDGQIVLTEPFASGFSTDRPVVVHAPAGYEVAEVSPTPTDQTDGTLTWESNTAFDRFELALESTEGAFGIQTPGFGLSVALASLGGAALLVWRRLD
jgi:PGF-CTERM protein